jgi:serine/threonine-protein kinase
MGAESAADTTVIAGRYELQQRVGEGALFIVCKARDRETGETVAVKALKPAMMQDQRLVERLIAEANAARVLDHPRIARVFDAGRDANVAYVVTEYVAGVSLLDRIRRTAPMPVAAAVNIGVEISEGLAYAHHLGMVHGDLRPGNVLINGEGHVKITDFGLARALTESANVEMNSVLRWVQCMSPEVAEGHAANTSSDTYSLGCILYEMLAGVPPFPGDNAIVVALKHAREKPRPVQEVNPSTPPALVAIITRALEKYPSLRYMDGATMLDDLRGVQDSLRQNRPLDYTPAQVLTPVTKPVPVVEPVYEEEEPVPRSLLIFRNILLTLVGVGVVLIAWLLYSLMQPQQDVVVPSVIGRNLDEAQQILTSKNLQGNAVPRPSAQPKNEVLNQDPLPSQSVKPGRTVTLYVSEGPRMVEVPAVTDMSVERARQVAADKNLTIKKGEHRYDESIQKDNVIDQSPEPGEKVKPGSAVTVTVSLGPEPPPPPPPPPPMPIEPTPDTNPAIPTPDQAVPGAVTPGQQIPGQVAPPSGMSPSAPSQRTGRVRTFRVGFRLPSSGYEQPVEVQIVVLDERGENTVVDEQHNLGDRVDKQIDAVGERVHIRVYLNGQLFSEEVK